MPIQTIKTASSACISSLKPVAGSSDLKIGCVSDLEKYKNEYVEYASALPHPKDSVGLNQRFFYKVQHYEFRNNKKSLLVGERGVGEIYKKRKDFFLRRHFAIGIFDNASSYRPRDGTPREFSAADDYFVLESYKPVDYHEALASPYSVLCSIEQNSPSPVELQEKTLLGRLDDRIQSIDAQELRQILNGDDDTHLKLTDKELEHVFKGIKKIIFDTLKDNKTAIVTKSQKIDLLTQHSSVAAPVLQVKPEYTDKDRPPKPKAGMIIFNKNKKAFEGYDGKFWKRLAWD
jgi:hypothetical protein